MREESKYIRLLRDIRENGWRDVCEICAHGKDCFDEDCDMECGSCGKVCTRCVDRSEWKWRGDDERN